MMKLSNINSMSLVIHLFFCNLPLLVCLTDYEGFLIQDLVLKTVKLEPMVNILCCSMVIKPSTLCKLIIS